MNTFMELAKKNAEIGVSKNEGGPFGAVIVDENNNIIATGNYYYKTIQPLMLKLYQLELRVKN